MTNSNSMTPLVLPALRLPGALTWLHLSDIHFKPDLPDQTMVLNRLLDDIRACRETEGWAPDVVFITGDIAWAGAKEEYTNHAARFLERLLAAAAVAKEQVFVIPGNHDVDRDAVTGMMKGFQNDLLKAGGANLAEFLTKKNHATDRAALFQRQHAYRAFVEQHLPHCVPQVEPGCYTCCVAVPAGLPFERLWVLGLNTAWLACQDEEHGRLLLGRTQLDRAFDPLEQSGSPSRDFVVALTHHPLGWLTEWDSRECKPRLSSQSDFHLSGHLHEHDFNFSGIVGPQRVSAIAAGSAYGSSDYYNGYHFLRLNFGEGKGRVWLRRFEPTTTEWRPDVRVETTQVGEFSWLLPKRWRKPEGGGKQPPEPEPPSPPVSPAPIENRVVVLPPPIDREANTPPLPPRDQYQNSDLCGRVLDGRYQIEAFLSLGGQGSVYRAYDQTLKRLVAIKVLAPALSNDPKHVNRFKREAQAAMEINHPNVVRVFDAKVSSEGITYLVMEYIAGQSLDRLLQGRTRIPLAEAVTLVEPLVLALEAAHRQGIIHRDIKPANVMVEEPSQRMVLLDLGIAKVQDLTALTNTKIPLGTPQYMAPEQWEIDEDETNSNPIDRRADLYSLGIVFYELVLGRRPFQGKTPYVLMNQHLNKKAPAMHDLEATIPLAVSDLINRTLAKDREQRPASCKVWLEELKKAIQEPVGEAEPTASTPPEPEPEVVIPSPTSPLVTLPQAMKNRLGMEFVLIPAGSFLMGSNQYDDERPVRLVTISQPYYLGKYQVTQQQWGAVMGNNPSHFKGDDLPVERVSWNDVQAFIRKLNGLGEGEYRLPSEAEWEYACRAGTTGDYAGNVDEMGWYYENSGDGRLADAKWNGEDLRSNKCRTHPVGQKKPNRWGLYDMHGNVWEWCQDWYGEYPSGSVTDPTGPPKGTYRVLRGGSWYDQAVYCRSALRLWYTPDDRYRILGFRLVRTAL